jgi:uncharacterized membrane protein
MGDKSSFLITALVVMAAPVGVKLTSGIAKDMQIVFAMLVGYLVLVTALAAATVRPYHPHQDKRPDRRRK